jgi:hypothetical protein
MTIRNEIEKRLGRPIDDEVWKEYAPEISEAITDPVTTLDEIMDQIHNDFVGMEQELIDLIELDLEELHKDDMVLT